MRGSRHKARRRRILASATLLVVVAAATGGWWYWRDGVAWLSRAWASATPPEKPPGQGAGPEAAALVVDATEEGPAWSNEGPPAPAGADEVLEPQHAFAAAWSWPEASDQERRPTTAATAGPSTTEPARSDNPAIEAARQKYAEGKLIEARDRLNTLLPQQASPADQAEIRRLLTTIADATVFSRRQLPEDPLADTYTVQSGDVLVRIGREYKVPPEVLMRINGIKDAALLRAEQKIKVLRGPFHARIDKSAFRLDVYLQEVYVRSFRVGLGADQGTPEGFWRVKERLFNPTYFPPASAENKRIIPADDPQNPLGEHWIGLEGLDGDAVGRVGYGIHGTIEPESVGKAVSLGCVRMHNEDVEVLYGLLLPGQSTVTILP